MWSRLPRICWICEVIGPHCGDSAENSAKKPCPAQPALCACADGAVEVGLLLGDGVFGALDLVGAAGIGRALVERGELALQAHAGRVRRLLDCAADAG